MNAIKVAAETMLHVPDAATSGHTAYSIGHMNNPIWNSHLREKIVRLVASWSFSEAMKKSY